MKLHLVRINIFIQSLSDVITNSSSELFAVIISDTKLNEIYKIIDNLFGYDQEVEMTPCVDLFLPNKDDEPSHKCWNYYEDDKNKYPNGHIQIDFPYRLEEAETFYKYGLEAILKEKFGDNFKIEYV